MRRIVLTLIVLIALACLAPKAFGLLVIGHHDRLVAGMAERLRGAELVAQETDSGWLTTRTRHRLRVTDPSSSLLIADLTGRPGIDGDPAIVVESRIAHGPWPLFEGKPGLARMHSRLSIDIGGDLIPVPGGAVTDIALDGSGTSTMEFQRLDTTVEGGASVLIWDGANLDVAFGPDLEHIESSGQVGSLTMLGPQGELRLGQAGIEGRSTATPYGFWAGSSRLTISDMSITAADGVVTRADDLVLDIDVTLDGETVGHRVNMTIDGLRSDEVDGAIRLSAQTEGLSGPALGRINQAETANAVDFLSILGPGSAVRVEDFTVRTDQGELAFTGRCRVPEDAILSGETADLLTSLAGEARLTISAGMLSGGQGSQYEPLLATGYLKRAEDGSVFADVRIGSGLMTVNGLPMPLIVPSGRL